MNAGNYRDIGRRKSEVLELIRMEENDPNDKC